METLISPYSSQVLYEPNLEGFIYRKILSYTEKKFYEEYEKCKKDKICTSFSIEKGFYTCYRDYNSYEEYINISLAKKNNLRLSVVKNVSDVMYLYEI